MISFVTGLTGSGKSYLTMLVLFTNFGKDKKIYEEQFKLKNIRRCYTNLKLNWDNIDSVLESENIINFNFQDFQDNLGILYSLYSQDVSDEELKEKAAEYNLKDCLFIIDECQKYFSKNNELLSWFLTYQRHLNYEVYLITQNLVSIDNVYRKQAHFFYEAVSSSYKLSTNRMVYKQYKKQHNGNLSEKVGKKTYKLYSSVFDYYESGNSDKAENILRKFGLYAVFAFAFLIALILGIQWYWTKDIDNPEERKSKQIINSNIANKATELTRNNNHYISPDIDYSNLKLFKFTCIKKMCNYKFKDKDNLQIPINILQEFIKDIKVNHKYINFKNSTTTFYILENIDNFTFLQNSKPGGFYEKDNKSNFSNVLPFGK